MRIMVSSDNKHGNGSYVKFCYISGLVQIR